MDEVEPPDVEVCRDERGFYWRVERSEETRSEYYASRDEAWQAARRWQLQERRRRVGRSRTPRPKEPPPGS